jgi:hypothetical protein
MPDGRPAKARRLQRQQLLSVWGPRALKRDAQRIAKFEGRPLSGMCAGLVRIGIARYFELSDDAKFEPLRALMRDVFGEDDWIPEHQVRRQSVKTKQRYVREARSRELRSEFDAAIEQGLRAFARRSANL